MSQQKGLYKNFLWYINLDFLLIINPLLPEFFFSSLFGTAYKIGSFLLPTHSRDAHRKKFLMIFCEI